MGQTRSTAEAWQVRAECGSLESGFPHVRVPATARALLATDTKRHPGEEPATKMKAFLTLLSPLPRSNHLPKGFL